MVKFRAKHVCTPGARRVKTPAWKRQVNKVKVVAVEKLPIDHIPEVKPKKRKKIDPMEYKLRINGVIVNAIAKTTKQSSDATVPRVTITSGVYLKGDEPNDRPKMTSDPKRKLDRSQYENLASKEKKKTN
jgi:hypothetical protein